MHNALYPLYHAIWYCETHEYHAVRSFEHARDFGDMHTIHDSMMNICLQKENPYLVVICLAFSLGFNDKAMSYTGQCPCIIQRTNLVTINLKLDPMSPNDNATIGVVHDRAIAVASLFFQFNLMMWFRCKGILHHTFYNVTNVFDKSNKIS